MHYSAKNRIKMHENGNSVDDTIRVSLSSGEHHSTCPSDLLALEISSTKGSCYDLSSPRGSLEEE